MNTPTLTQIMDAAKAVKSTSNTDKSVGEIVAMLIMDIDKSLTPAQVAPAPVRSREARTARKSADWKSTVTASTDHCYVRLVACELALMDAYADSPIDGYSTLDCVPTHGAVSDAYKALMPYVAAVTVNFGRGSAHYTEAAALVA
jgi:hypothetical protein